MADKSRPAHLRREWAHCPGNGPVISGPKVGFENHIRSAGVSDVEPRACCPPEPRTGARRCQGSRYQMGGWVRAFDDDCGGGVGREGGTFVPGQVASSPFCFQRSRAFVKWPIQHTSRLQHGLSQPQSRSYCSRGERLPYVVCSGLEMRHGRCP